ncbi:efflux RND transporter periplasmic adaptor subunit [Sansalvadorimonas sp. 2012CJ34-2]|uniref:Efflux RND transporter periplasmic adaptor subunit n=1 Tax=Parendozoicomonas callyspongiae TaxID=2942213 RepID=A0ABT0PJV3_9GAMM|nr:efflux RND transporter periplasmic adaptor subunit [Sansalvadorimonas sp. 2012CJ34-2]MCL6271613.1 efflux RND transporter periplasmic adaptor subunit [Sansalvadorimonas sp. 2012CJ34-2]
MQITKNLSIKAAPLLLGMALLAGCSEENQQGATQHQIPPPAVSVASVTNEAVGDYAEFVARTEASESVDLRARVEGFLQERNFIEGETVQKDQLLFKIDPAPFKASLSQANAKLASARAAKVQAAADLERGRELFPQGHISKANLDSLISAEAQAVANVESAKAQVETARINLSYSEINAPFSGKIGKETYSVGNLVGPSSDPLASLIKVDPMYVNFQVNEKLMITYQQQHQGNGNVNQEFSTSLKLPNGAMYDEPGSFDFADIKVDETTGTVNMRAAFPNPDKLLLPGLYVTLIIKGTQKQDKPLIPQAAVQENQQGRFVLVVNSENKVDTRIIKTGRRIGPMWVVESGLKASEKIIVSGLQKVRPGIVVTPVMKVVDMETGTFSDPANAGSADKSAEAK